MVQEMQHVRAPKSCQRLNPAQKLKPCNRIVTMILYCKPTFISALLKAKRRSQEMLQPQDRNLADTILRCLSFGSKKTTLSYRLQRQRKPKASVSPKTTWLLETKFPSPRSTPCLKFRRNVEHTLSQFTLHPPENLMFFSKCNPTSSLSPDFNQKDEAGSGKR